MVTKSVKKSWLKSVKKKTNSSAKPKASRKMARMMTVRLIPMALIQTAPKRAAAPLPQTLLNVKIFAVTSPVNLFF